jgi:hypothetical protein
VPSPSVTKRTKADSKSPTPAAIRSAPNTPSGGHHMFGDQPVVTGDAQERFGVIGAAKHMVIASPDGRRTVDAPETPSGTRRNHNTEVSSR